MIWSAVPRTYHDGIVCRAAPGRQRTSHGMTVEDPAAGPSTTPRTRRATAASTAIQAGLRPPRNSFVSASPGLSAVRLRRMSRSSTRDHRDHNETVAGDAYQNAAPGDMCLAVLHAVPAMSGRSGSSRTSETPSYYGRATTVACARPGCQASRTSSQRIIGYSTPTRLLNHGNAYSNQLPQARTRAPVRLDVILCGHASRRTSVSPRFPPR